MVAEVDVRDPRFALAYVSHRDPPRRICGLVRRVRFQARASLPPVAAAICIFIVVSYVAWEGLFSILRYALGLEVLTGIVIVLGLRAAANYLPWVRGSATRLPVACAIVLIAIVAVSSRPGWGRLRHYGASTFDIHAPAIPDGATIVLADKPIGFAAPFLRGKDIAFVGIVDVPASGLLHDAIQRRVHNAAPALALIDLAPRNRMPGCCTRFGIRIDPAQCQPIGGCVRSRPGPGPARYEPGGRHVIPTRETTQRTANVARAFQGVMAGERSATHDWHLVTRGKVVGWPASAGHDTSAWHVAESQWQRALV